MFRKTNREVLMVTRLGEYKTQDGHRAIVAQIKSVDKNSWVVRGAMTRSLERLAKANLGCSTWKTLKLDTVWELR